MVGAFLWFQMLVSQISNFHWRGGYVQESIYMEAHKRAQIGDRIMIALVFLQA
jgi:hypothetical protein